MKTVIMTDSSCDLPLEFIEKNNVPFLGLTCHFKGKDYEDDFGKTFTYQEFYKGIRAGEMPTTSQINIFRFIELFKKLTDENISVIYLGMSSGISGTINSAMIARKSVIEQNKNADITVIDTKCACIGEGIVVYNAVNMLKNGASKDEIIKWVEENKMKVNHWFMVGSLKHLLHGGRISRTKAIVGTLIKVNPIIYIDDNGNLINVANIRGRRKAMSYLIEKFEEKVVDLENQTIMISHGDCIEDAKYIEKILKEKFNVKNTIINYVGPVIASHTGPDMLSVCFIGNDRNYKD